MYKDDGFFDENYDDIFKLNSTDEAIKYLMKKIHEIDTYLRYFHDLIPMKYKKINLKAGENPFFTGKQKEPTAEDYENAKKRMAQFFDNSQKK